MTPILTGLIVPVNVNPKVHVDAITLVIHDEHGFEELYVGQTTSCETIKDMISVRLGILPHFVELYDMNGDAWMMTRARRQHVYQGNAWARGGAGGTVSPTEPHVPQDRSPAPQPRYEARPRSSRSRSRDARRVMRGNDHAESWWSDAVPTGLPPAQEEPVSMGAYADDIMVGHLRRS